MSDLIDRQAAIDALGEKPLAWTEGEYELGMQNQWQSDIDAIEALPSAQPEKRTEERTETHGVCLDAISRQAAIDIVEFECGEWRGLAGTIVKAIEQLPSTQPDAVSVVHGRWIDYDEVYSYAEIQCSVCLRTYHGDDLCSVGDNTLLGFPHYCPHCGARMDEEREEE